MRYSILIAILSLASPSLASATATIWTSVLAPSDSTAGPFVVHVRVSPEEYPTISRVLCVVEASADSATISRAWGMLKAGDRHMPEALWCTLAPDKWVKNPNRIRFSFGLRRDLAESGRFYLSIPAPTGGAVWSWEIDLAQHLRE
jgi:hypothetical protein